MYDHVEKCFHVKTRHSIGSNNRKPCTYHVNLQRGSCTCNKTLLLRFPCSHILVASHCWSIDFRQFVQGYYTTRAYLSTWAPLFYPIFDKLEWPQYNGPIIIPSDLMKRIISSQSKSNRLYNEMDEGKLELHKYVDFASKRVTIDVLVLIEKPMIGVDVLHEHLINVCLLEIVVSCQFIHILLISSYLEKI